MEPWIQQAKTKIVKLTKQVTDENPNADILVSFVGYRDYGDAEPILTLPFQTPSDIMWKIRGVFAEGGNDQAEDVAHGLQAALGFDWSESDVKIVFHIADAPAHGLTFHTARVSDRYPGGDPHGIDPRDSIEKMSFMDVQYTFVKIHDSTDTMIEQFHNCYSHGGSFTVIDLRAQGEYAPHAFSEVMSECITRSITQHTASIAP